MSLPWRLTRVVRVLLTLALWAFAVGIALTGLAARVAPLVGTELLAVRSGSMSPAIGVGDILIVEIGRMPGVDQVVAFETPAGSVIAHRVAGSSGPASAPVLQTRGDANPAPDPWQVTPGEVIGTATGRLPYLGLVLGMLALPSGVVAIVCLALAMLCAVWLLEEIEDELATFHQESPAAGQAPRGHDGAALA